MIGHLYMPTSFLLSCRLQGIQQLRVWAQGTSGEIGIEITTESATRCAATSYSYLMNPLHMVVKTLCCCLLMCRCIGAELTSFKV